MNAAMSSDIDAATSPDSVPETAPLLLPSQITEPDVTIVTGAAGWLGTGLVTELTGTGRWARSGVVRGLVRADDDARHLPASVETVRGDVTDPASLDRLFADVASTPSST
jgi:NAD(P)-dependent dehydrogenase (short-subunit alcohol dehydrogenase family)